MEHDIISFITEKLMKKFSNNLSNRILSPFQKPILYLVLRGNNPLFSGNLDLRNLQDTILKQFPVVTTRIYEKYVENIRTLETFIPVNNIAKI
jgi:hypothetical protein